MARSKRNKDGYVLKSEIQNIVQNYIRTIQMNDYGDDSGIPQLYWAMGLIDNTPPADVVEVEHSKWNECYTNESNEKFCNSCGCGFNLYYHNRADFRFCPYCGAMMHNDWIKHDNNEEKKNDFKGDTI